MANEPISSLPVATTVGQNDLMLIDQVNPASPTGYTTKTIAVNQAAGLTPCTFATLPSPPYNGQMALMGDAVAPAWLQTVPGGGGMIEAPVYYSMKLGSWVFF